VKNVRSSIVGSSKGVAVSRDRAAIRKSMSTQGWKPLPLTRNRAVVSCLNTNLPTKKPKEKAEVGKNEKVMPAAVARDECLQPHSCIDSKQNGMPNVRRRVRERMSWPQEEKLKCGEEEQNTVVCGSRTIASCGMRRKNGGQTCSIYRDRGAKCDEHARQGNQSANFESGAENPTVYRNGGSPEVQSSEYGRK